MTDTDMNNLSLYLEKNYGLTSDRVIAKAIDIVANDNSFHPIIDVGRQTPYCRDADSFLRGGKSRIFRRGYEDAHAGSHKPPV